MILKIALPTALRRSFDYLPPPQCDHGQLTPGVRVKVPFRNSHTIGILLGIAPKSEVPANKLKAAISILDPLPLLTPTIMELGLWAANYYHHSIGEVLISCLPTLLRTKDHPNWTAALSSSWEILTSNHALNAGQQQAIQAILEAPSFTPFLLDGITGSGKTEVYLQVIAEKLKQGKQALVLVPEIGLTPQTLLRFTSRFNAPIISLHSNLTEKQRLQGWADAKQGQAAIIIGTRSAIFTPLANPGIIIIDEEHDLSFKQQTGFRYSARDLAVMRGQLENIPVILGSATPSLESLHNVARKHYHYLQLTERAGNAVLPTFNVIDIREQTLEEGLSPQLIQAMQHHLQQDQQVLLFLNRRGFAPLLLCRQCRWIAQCQRCDANLTLHQHPKKLVCHHCESQTRIPERCAQCQSPALLMLGLGTERLEHALTQHFPDVEIIRIDRDSTRRKGALSAKLQQIHQGKKQILIGTQMLTKGHHFPEVTLVAIVNTDHYLFSNDFRATERLGQLLIQVAGRAGRADKKGEVCLQTHFPNHPYLLQLIQTGYSSFAKTLLQDRQTAQLPPFAHLALLRAEAVSDNLAIEFLKTISAEIKQLNNTHIQLLGPLPAPLAKKAGLFRAQLFIQSAKRMELQKLLKALQPLLESSLQRKVRWSLDVDPLEIY